MIVTELLLQDVLKIKAVRITPDGNVVKITGKNAQGKSAVLDGLEMVLRGPTAFPDEPIRTGAKQGAGQVDLGDIVVTRHIDPHKLVVQYKGSDEKIKRPQEFLDSLLNKYTCDPLRLMNLSATEQLDEVKLILGIDFAKLDEEYDVLYEDRRDKKKETRILENLTKEYDSTAPVWLVDDKALEEEYKMAQEANKMNQEMRFELSVARNHIKELRRQEEDLEKQLANIRGEIEQKTGPGKELALKVDALQDTDEPSLYAKVQKAKENNNTARENAKIAGFIKELRDNADVLEKIDRRITEIKEHKIKTICEAEFSVDGLSIKGNTLYYGDVPLSQASQAEQLKVCLALSVAGKPDIRVVLIRQASLLDDNNLELIAKEAEEKGFQVWLEIVGEDDPLSFVIEDGEVVHSPTEGDMVTKQVKLF